MLAVMQETKQSFKEVAMRRVGMFPVIGIFLLFAVQFMVSSPAYAGCCGTGMCRSGCLCSCMTVVSGTLSNLTHVKDSVYKGRIALPFFPEAVEFEVSDKTLVEKLTALKNEKAHKDFTRFTLQLVPKVEGDRWNAVLQCVGLNQEAPDHTVELGATMATPTHEDIVPKSK